MRHMRQWFMVGVAGIVWLVGFPNDLPAEEITIERLERLEREVQQIKEQNLKSRPDEAEATSKLSFHGYGELHYNKPKTGATVPKGSDPAEMDFHRMVWGLSYQFSDRISVHTEVDFEHAAKEIELEFAYLDFLIAPAFNLRAGSMLMPVGPLNEFHEPPLFYSVERPYVQTNIIPTTWQEGGVGVFGSLPGGLNYRVYGVSGLNAEKFSDSTGIRGGRGKVGSSPSDDLAAVARLEYVGFPGLDVGGSVYSGGANGTKNPAVGRPTVGIWELDVRVRKAGFDLRGVGAYLRLDEADKISTVAKKTIGSEMHGWYLEGAYNVLRLLAPDSEQSLVAFARYETFNTHKTVPSGLTASPTNDRQVTTGGVAYYPHQDVAIKADVEGWRDGKENAYSRLNLGLAYQF